MSNIEGVDTKRALANAITREVAQGWRVESQTTENAVLVKGKQTSHGIHIFLSIVTVGFWLPVWGIMWYLNRRKTVTLDVDEYGNVHRNAL